MASVRKAQPMKKGTVLVLTTEGCEAYDNIPLNLEVVRDNGYIQP